jgi:hypothetical protein
MNYLQGSCQSPRTSAIVSRCAQGAFASTGATERGPLTARSQAPSREPERRLAMRCVSAVVRARAPQVSGGRRLGHQSELRHHLNLIEVEPSGCDGLPFDAEDLHSAAV